MRHRASGEPADGFHFDANLLDDYCPEEETANAIIMAARQHWFENDDNEGGAEGAAGEENGNDAGH